MANITVYRYRIRDETAAGWSPSAGYATLSTIERMQTEPVEETARVVNEAQVDSGGFYPRRKRRPPA